MIVIVLCFSGLCDYVLCCSGCSGCSGCRGLGRRGCRCSADERTAAENGGGLGAEPARYLRSALFRASVADGRESRNGRVRAAGGGGRAGNGETQRCTCSTSCFRPVSAVSAL